MKSIAVASYSLSVSPALRVQLEKRYPGVQIVWNTTDQVLDPFSLVRFLKGHSHAIVGREKIDATLLRQLPELEVVSKYGVGLDSLDLDAMAKAGVLLGWKPGVNRRAVAELALTFMLMAIRKVHLAERGLRSGSWQRPQGLQLTEKTVGIIGCGHVGRELAVLLAPFHCRILTYDIRADEDEYRGFFGNHGITAVSLENLLERSDIVSLHAPKNPTTAGIIDAAALNRMSPGAVLVNTARGGLVDEEALLRALKENHLGAAALDVFAEEPSPSPELIAHPQFIGTPHIGGASDEAIRAMGETAIEGLASAGDPLELKRYQ